MKFTSQNKQLTFDLFRSSLEELDKTNRWVMLGDLLPWAEIEKRYNSKLNNQVKGAGNKPARLIIGAMIIKHKLNLGDEETIQMIQENPYMQYMCGLPEYTTKPVFDPSLFVTIRKRISEEELNDMTVSLLKEQRIKQEEKRKDEEGPDKGNSPEPPSPAPANPDAQEFTDSKGRLHKGVLKIDATCANAEVRYPVDIDIVNDGLRILSVFDTDEWFEMANKFHLRINNEEFNNVIGHENDKIMMLKQYHSPKHIKKYNEIIKVCVTEFFTDLDMEKLQLMLLRYLNEKEIIIETLPTSNVRIGHHHTFDTYHLWNWIKWEKDGHSIPPIVVGSDDTGIFATNIYNEYANIYCKLVHIHGMSRSQAMDVIYKLDRNAQIYKFT